MTSSDSGNPPGWGGPPQQQMPQQQMPQQQMPQQAQQMPQQAQQMPPPGYGQAPVMGAAPGYGPPPYQQGALGQVPVRKVGLFGKIPCPYCGMDTSSSASGSGLAMGFGGLLGVMLLWAVASKYHCPSHGEITLAALPSEHRTLVYIRKGVIFGGIGMLVFLLFILMVVASFFGGY